MLGVTLALSAFPSPAQAVSGIAGPPVGGPLALDSPDGSRPADPEGSTTEQRLLERAAKLLEWVWKPVLFASLVGIASLVVLIRRRFGAAIAQPVGVHPGLAAVLLAAFCYLAAQSLGLLLVQGLGGVEWAPSIPVASVLAQAGAILLGLWLFRSGLRRPFEVLGVHGRQALPAGALALLIYVAQLPVFMGVLVLNNSLVKPDLQEQVMAIAEHREALYRGLWLVAVVILAPALEELVFRALLLPPLRRRLGVAGGVIVSALLFMVVHPPGTYLPIFWLGVVLGLAYHYTGTLLAPVLIHAVHNGVQFVLIVWLTSGA